MSSCPFDEIPEWVPGLCFCHGVRGGQCPADFGPWGAWRAIAPIMTEMAVYYSDNPEEWDKMTHYVLWYFWADDYLDAVGWSS